MKLYHVKDVNAARFYFRNKNMSWHHYFTQTLVPHSSSESNIPDIYDGEDLIIPPLTYVVLFPCFNPDHNEIDLTSCRVLTKHGIVDAEKTSMHIIFVIDNTHAEEPLLLKHGAVLGSYFDSPHDNIKAEKSFTLTPVFNEMSTAFESLDLQPAADSTIDVSEIKKK
jgi:hypothetical protein